MFLHIYSLGGRIKYSGFSSKIPSFIERKIYDQSLKIYDIGGIMLFLFNENSFIKEYNEKGIILNLGYIKNGKIRKEVKKINENTLMFNEDISENNSSIENHNPLELSHHFQDLSPLPFNFNNFTEYNLDTESTISSYDEYEDEYEGEIVNNIPNGRGIFYKKKSSPEYIGHWLDGQRHGKGIFYENNKKIYYGEWKENNRSGFGISYFQGKKTFEGTWKNDFPYSGKIYDSLSNIVYNGPFSKYSGTFIFTNINKYEIYIGSFKDGKRDGYGEVQFYYDESIYYRGLWKNDKKSGYGEEIFNDIKYIGYWKDNKYDGYGTSYEISENDIGNDTYIKEYSGYWKNGKKEGKGIYFNDDGRFWFEGEFKEDGPYYGTQYYENSNIQYKGYFNDYTFEGEGILYYPHSSNICFKGTFKGENPFHGTFYSDEGMEENKTKRIDGNYYTFSKTFSDDGTIQYEGYFKNGIYHGEGILQFGDKIIYKGTFLNGFYWNGENTLQYPDFISSPIIFKGSLKNEKYFTGIEYIYEVDYFNDILYENGPIFYKKWINGELVDEEKERNELKQEMKILSYLETKQKKMIKKIGKEDFIRFLQKKYNITQKDNLFKKDLVNLIEKEYYSKKNKKFIEKEEYDLFGNEIKNPVIGSDGETYDESSMIYLFERNENMEFKNIPYIYNEKDECIPNYPIMSNGKPLYSYKKKV
jgi:hypothetical protein